jgi:spore germination cell wall hydrolase CwlJ-like protein
MTLTGRLATLIAALGVSIVAFNHFNKPEVVDISHIKPIVVLPDPIPEAETVLVKLDQSEFECMRANMYYEARNQKTDDAYIAVGYTVKNRVGKRGYPDTLCGVVQQKKFVRRKGRWVCQYSWFCDGKSDVPNLANVIERKAWERAGELAAAVMRDEVDNPIGNATMYHATYVKPDWDYKKLSRVAHIESHIFYQLKV